MKRIGRMPGPTQLAQRQCASAVVIWLLAHPQITALAVALASVKSARSDQPLVLDAGLATLAHPISRSTRIGSSRTRRPVACHTALAIDAATPVMPISPTPFDPIGQMSP